MVIVPALALLLAASSGAAQGGDGLAAKGPVSGAPAPAVVRCIRLLRDSRRADALPAEHLAAGLRRDSQR